MLVRSLAITLFILFTGAHGLSNMCQMYLEPKVSVLEELEHFVDSARVNQELEGLNLLKLDAFISQVEALNVDFNRKWMEALSPYGVSFLPRLRQKLIEISNTFQESNNEILSELMRFQQERRLTFRGSILDAIKKSKSSTALAYLENSDKVYFGLEYFINTFGEPGYLLTKIPKRLSDEVNQSITVVIETDTDPLQDFYNSAPDALKERGSDGVLLRGSVLDSEILRFLGRQRAPLQNRLQHYPLTNYIIPREKGPDGLSVSGLVLDRRVLDFFKAHGDRSGHINVTYPVYEQPRRFGSIFRRQFALDDTNWDFNKNAYIPLYDSELNDASQTRSVTLSDPGGYTLHNSDGRGLLATPVIPVIRDVERTFSFFREGSPYYVESHDDRRTELLLPPNHFEFTVALYFLIYQN